MTDHNIRTELDADGVLLATIDMPGRTMNVFSADMMTSLEALMNRVDADAAIKSVVLTSGKSAFIAGADLDMIRMFTERARTGATAELHALFGHLGRLFRRLELSKKTYVAAINGLALGGGLEVSLACHQRVAANDEKTVQLGLPEIKLGLLPGAGGTQRLPRLIGTAKGLEMLLTGEPLGPQSALELGLVDEIVAAADLIAAAKCRAKASAMPQAPWDRAGFNAEATPFDFDSKTAFADIARAVGISDYQLKYYPAYNAIMDCVVGGWHLPMTEASRREMDIFVELMRDPVAGNMVRTLFLNRQKASKLGLLKPDSLYDASNGALLPRVKAARDQAQGLSEDELVLSVVLAALQVWAEGAAGQAELADVAVVNAGLIPAYTGGPFNWLQQHGAAAIGQATALSCVADAASALPLIERYFAASEAVPA